MSKCPLCGKPTAAAYDPFCSRGCRDRDLLQWMSDGYRIPGSPADDDEADRRDLHSDGLDSGETRQ